MAAGVPSSDPVSVDRVFLDALLRQLVIEFRDSEDHEARRNAGYLIVAAAARGLFPSELVKHLPRDMRASMRELLAIASAVPSRAQALDGVGAH
jgi:hypothetical protein